MKLAENIFGAIEKRQSSVRFIRHTISIPFIYGMGIVLVIFDIGVEIYHRICFPLYGIPLVNRKEYIKIDRVKLGYLNLVQKFNCLYCGYANGLMGYSTEIIAQTEQFWCAIKHDVSNEKFNVPAHHKNFATYGSGENPSQHLTGYVKK
jgi:hypothetical protein